MKLIPRLVLCATLLVASSAPALSQKQKKTACPVPPPSPFKHNGQIATKFDKAGGMRTTLEHPRSLAAGGAAIYLSASFTHQDPRRPAAPTLELTFVSVAPVQKFREAHDLVLLCDGARRSFAGATSYQKRDGGPGSTLEAAKVKLSYDDVLAVTRARKVAARLGVAEFELTNNHLEALRELASLMAPSPSRWRTSE